MGPAIGIDFGNSYCCVAVWQNSWVEVLANDQGSRKTPSWVAFRDHECLVGDAARDQGIMNASGTIFDVKKLTGRNFSDASFQADMLQWPFSVSPGPRDLPQVTVRYNGETREFAAEHLTSILIAKLKQMAEEYLHCRISECVITVPASFGVKQRQAIVAAGGIAGMTKMKLVSEPTAAALAYALHRDSIMSSEEKLIMIYDLGGGSLSVSVVYVFDSCFEVKSTAGDSHLGGRDFDLRMVDYFVKEFLCKHDKDVSGNARAMRKLEMACERAKRNLSVSQKAVIQIDGLFEGIDFYTSITREQFEALSHDLFHRCVQPVVQCLQEVNKSRDLIHEVVLVGGCTRIPKLQQMLKDFFHGKKLCTSVNQDEAVAFGSAVYAAIYDPHNHNERLQLFLPLDVSAMSIGVEGAGGSMIVVIPKNSTLPAANRMDFLTYPDEHSCVTLPIYEGENVRTIDNNLLTVIEVVDIPPAPVSGIRVSVDIEVDGNGLMTVNVEGKNGEKYRCLKRKPTTPFHAISK